ncbi:hypothetical protein AB3Y40_18295 [Yoonia sp. R2331]
MDGTTYLIATAGLALAACVILMLTRSQSPAKRPDPARRTKH